VRPRTYIAVVETGEAQADASTTCNATVGGNVAREHDPPVKMVGT
jgi:hypothetical protein